MENIKDLKRYDVDDRSMKLYPQYYNSKYFVPQENGRFVLWKDVEILFNKNKKN